MPINKQGYFEEYYPNFEFAQSISRLNPEQFSGVVYNPASGRAVFAPPSPNRGQPGGEQDISPEKILQEQMALGRKRIEEDYEMDYNTHRNEYAADDINFINLARDAPQYADQFMRQRDVAAAVFQKKTAGSLTDRDMALLKLKRQGEDVRNLWSIIDKKKNEITPENALKAKTDAIKMSGFPDAIPTEVFEDNPSVKQEAMREIEKRATMFPYLMELEKLEREAKGVSFGISEKKEIEQIILDMIKTKPDRWWASGRRVIGLQEVFNEMLEGLNWKNLTTTQKKWFLTKFNMIAKQENSNWKDIPLEAVEKELLKKKGEE